MTENVNSPYSLMQQGSEGTKSAFLTFEKPSKSQFLTQEDKDKIPQNRHGQFLESKDISDEKSPLEISKNQEDKEQKALKSNTPEYHKDNNTIISELKRNPMHSLLTARDIAKEYDISYQAAIDIFKAVNEDANGITREFNLPDENATVSFLV